MDLQKQIQSFMTPEMCITAVVMDTLQGRSSRIFPRFCKISMSQNVNSGASQLEWGESMEARRAGRKLGNHVYKLSEQISGKSSFQFKSIGGVLNIHQWVLHLA